MSPDEKERASEGELCRTRSLSSLASRAAMRSAVTISRSSTRAMAAHRKPRRSKSRTPQTPRSVPHQPFHAPGSEPTPAAVCSPALAPDSVSDLLSLLTELNMRKKHVSPCNPTADEAQLDLAQLCQQAAIGVHRWGTQLPAHELAFLGSSTWHVTTILPTAEVANLAEATIAAAMRAPAMHHASIADWSALLHGLTKAGAIKPSLHELMAYALRHMATAVWQAGVNNGSTPDLHDAALLMCAYAAAGYQGDVNTLVRGTRGVLASRGLATAKAHDCSTIVWALGGLGCKMQQTETAALLRLVGQAVANDIMEGAKPQAWSHLLVGLAKCGCHVDYTTTLDVRSVVAAAVKSVQQATAQEWSDVLCALATMGCRSAPGAQPDISPLLTKAITAVQHGIMKSATPEAWGNLLWALAIMGCHAAPGSYHDITPVVAHVVSHVQEGRMQHATPRAWSNMLWALAQSRASKALVQPVIDQAVPELVHQAHSRQCSDVEIAQLLHALHHYGMAGEKHALLANLPTTSTIQGVLRLERHTAI